ncbi:MAG: peptidylprolyl isomerase [Desulfuromonadales bacterium]|nr:peptidylprolyl isomerase [Desulfuromonadales bacterium]MDW7758891.1 peptidylprolyl isomerase [Desulfuromonadales bacterium]
MSFSYLNALKCLLIIGFFLLFTSQTVMGDESVVARVGGIPITTFELKRQVSRILPLNSSYHGGVSREKLEEIEEKALGELIEQAMKVRYALDNEIVVSSAELEARLQPVWEKFPTPELLGEALQGESVSALRASVYRGLIAKKAEKVAIAQQVNVPEAEVKDFYQTNSQRFFRPRMFRASQIFIKVDPRLTPEQKRPFLEKARDLAERGKAGEDFYNLAYYNSDDEKRYVGGDLGFFHEGQLIADIERAVVQMQDGEVSDPVESIYGYHVLKLVEIKDPVQLSYDEKKDDIRRELEQQRYETLYAAWMTALRDACKVERIEKPVASVPEIQGPEEKKTRSL